MRMCSLLAALVGMTVVADLPGADQKSDDAKKIQGRWAIVREDKPDPPGKDPEKAEAAVQGTPVEITDKTITVKDDEHDINWVMTYKLDPSKQPKQIAMTITLTPSKVMPSQGIYELDGDHLKICYGITEKAVPTKFAAEEGKFNLFVLERVAPKKE